MSSSDSLRTPFAWPLSGVGLGVGLLFVTIGAVMCSFADASKAPNYLELLFDPETPGNGRDGALLFIGGAFVLLGGLAAGLFAYKKLVRYPVEHAPDATFPDLPRAAERVEDLSLSQFYCHELTGDGREGALQPRANPHRAQTYGIIGFMLLFLSFFCTVVMIHSPEMGSKNDHVLKILFCVAGCVAGAIAAALIIYLLRRSQKRLGTLRWDGAGFAFTRDGEVLCEGQRAALRGLQVCALKARGPSEDGGSSFYSGLQLNLLHEVEGELRRIPLLHQSAGFWRLFAATEQMASQLELPLLFHATPEDFRKARRMRAIEAM